MDVKRGLKLPIYDLDCPAVAITVERALAGIDGVLRAYVNPATQTAYVDYDADVTNPRLIAGAFQRSGYRSGAPVDGSARAVVEPSSSVR
ncbi:MAG: heavy metal-associated domain-containing protein [Chloroflexota bacterium]